MIGGSYLVSGGAVALNDSFWVFSCMGENFCINSEGGRVVQSIPIVLQLTACNSKDYWNK
jgi:hypothetical protein